MTSKELIAALDAFIETGDPVAITDGGFRELRRLALFGLAAESAPNQTNEEHAASINDCAIEALHVCHACDGTGYVA